MGESRHPLRVFDGWLFGGSGDDQTTGFAHPPEMKGDEREEQEWKKGRVDEEC